MRETDSRTVASVRAPAPAAPAPPARRLKARPAVCHPALRDRMPRHRSPPRGAPYHARDASARVRKADAGRVVFFQTPKQRPSRGIRLEVPLGLRPVPQCHQARDGMRDHERSIVRRQPELLCSHNFNAIQNSSKTRNEICGNRITCDRPCEDPAAIRHKIGMDVRLERCRCSQLLGIPLQLRAAAF
jgi:hypothetical protein